VAPNPGIGIAYAISALGWSKRPNAARLFADYVLSVAGQTAWHGKGESASPLPGIPGSLDGANITPWDPDACPPDIVKACTARFNSIFK
jgi:ABC-type Fe3+ transport system substrate-binding protein